MELQEALNKAVQEFGNNVLTEPRLLNILNDYQGFEEMPAARVILKTMQEEGYMSQIIKIASFNKITISQIQNKIHKRLGFEMRLVESITNAILESAGYSVAPSSIVTSKSANLSSPSKQFSITEICEDDLKKVWIDNDSVQYSQNKKRLLKASKSIKYYSIQKGTKIICDKAFSDCLSMEKIIFPEGLTHIGNQAFSMCKSLSDILYLPKSLKQIGDYAFSWCLSLKYIVFDNKIEHIGKDAFRFCFLEKIFVPSGSRSHFEDMLPKDLHKAIIEGNQLVSLINNLCDKPILFKNLNDIN